jgi:fluoride ion exporter CrcB/FEX
MLLELMSRTKTLPSPWKTFASMVFGVISYRCVRERELIRTPYGYFIINLGISDLLMGIYLYIIAVADVSFHGEYFLHETSWRESFACKFAGVITTLSSEVSVCFTLLISLHV